MLSENGNAEMKNSCLERLCSCHTASGDLQLKTPCKWAHQLEECS